MKKHATYWRYYLTQLAGLLLCTTACNQAKKQLLVDTPQHQNKKAKISHTATPLSSNEEDVKSGEEGIYRFTGEKRSNYPQRIEAILRRDLPELETSLLPSLLEACLLEQRQQEAYEQLRADLEKKLEEAVSSTRTPAIKALTEFAQENPVYALKVYGYLLERLNEIAYLSTTEVALCDLIKKQEPSHQPLQLIELLFKIIQKKGSGCSDTDINKHYIDLKLNRAKGSLKENMEKFVTSVTQAAYQATPTMTEDTAIAIFCDMLCKHPGYLATFCDALNSDISEKVHQAIIDRLYNRKTVYSDNCEIGLKLNEALMPTLNKILGAYSESTSVSEELQKRASELKNKVPSTEISLGMPDSDGEGCDWD